jgi:hypothetical protein
MGDGRRFRQRYGPLALVAGAAEGIGAAFAEQLARRGLDLMLLDRQAEACGALAARLRAAHRIECRALVCDLGAPDLLERLQAELSDAAVGLVVYNAARSTVGGFLQQPLADKLATLDVNCRGWLLLAHHFGAAMAGRGRGGLIVMSSLAGTHGHGLVATYGATKAFDWLLAEALWDELGPRGVDVLAVCAGMTRTPGFERSGPRLGRLQARLVLRPQQVAAGALDALGRGPRFIPGASYRLTQLINDRLLPRGLASRWLGRTMRRIYPDR